jgi:hypothetical protein
MSDIQQTIKAAWNRKQVYAAIKEKFQESLTFSHSGGMWKADRETISFLSAFLHFSPEQITMEDIYGVPRQVNPKELLDLCITKYQYVANNWAVEYRELSSIRRAENV